MTLVRFDRTFLTTKDTKACTKHTKNYYFIVALVHALVGAAECGRGFVVKYVKCSSTIDVLNLLRMFAARFFRLPCFAAFEFQHVAGVTHADYAAERGGGFEVFGFVEFHPER